MLSEERAIVEALLPVAWADGTFEDTEREMIRGLLEAYQANEQETAEVLALAEERRELDSINLQELSAGDRRIVISYAVLLTFADGAQAAAERAFLDELAKHLHVPEEEAKTLISEAEFRAKQHLDELK